MYIDPNTGGMLFQILAASLALFSGFILLMSGKIRSFIARIRRSFRKELEDSTITTPDVDSNEDRIE
jgi:hypothetical protein